MCEIELPRYYPCRPRPGLTQLALANHYLQDWDLKMGKGNCLNSLGESTFDVSLKNMLSISASVPKAVKRVHEIFEKPMFMKSVSGSDIKQGSLGDCWFISCVSGLANVEGGLQRACVAYDTSMLPASGLV